MLIINVRNVLQKYRENKINKKTCRNSIIEILQLSNSNCKLKSRVIQNLPRDIVNRDLKFLKSIFDSDV